MTSEAPAPSRRRDRGRAARAAGPSLAPLPRLTNRWAPLEVLSAEQLERILDAAYRVLEEAGLEVRSAAAREVYRRAGALVDEPTQLVRLGRDLIEAQLSHAPERFVYVSCGFESFLKDTAQLTGRGKLRLTALTAFNLMPFTEHVETVARFERA